MPGDAEKQMSDGAGSVRCGGCRNTGRTDWTGLDVIRDAGSPGSNPALSHGKSVPFDGILSEERGKDVLTCRQLRKSQCRHLRLETEARHPSVAQRGLDLTHRHGTVSRLRLQEGDERLRPQHCADDFSSTARGRAQRHGTLIIRDQAPTTKVLTAIRLEREEADCRAEMRVCGGGGGREWEM